MIPAGRLRLIAIWRQGYPKLAASIMLRRIRTDPEGAAAMAEHSTPHFHNQPGVAVIRTGAREFMCIGALPPFDHPHIFIDLGGDNEAICSYCSTRFVYDATLKGGCEPKECALTVEAAH